MSLLKALGEAALKKNISTEVRAGKPVAQAAAIGYSIEKKVKSGKAKKQTKKVVKKVNKKFKLP